MLTAALLGLLCSAPVKIAATGFQVSGEKDPARAGVWLERFAEVMRRNGRVQVSTSNDIAQILGLERQKQLFGCTTDGSSCIAELADALGANGVLVGTFNRTDDAYLVVLRILRQPGGEIWWSASSRVKGESALLDWLDEQAAACADALAPVPAGSRAPFIVGGAGLALLIGGGVLLGVAHTVGLQAVRGAPTEPQLSSALGTGRAESGAGVVLVSVGAAAVGAAVVWKLVDREPARVALTPVPGGAVMTFGGTW